MFDFIFKFILKSASELYRCLLNLINQLLSLLKQFGIFWGEIWSDVWKKIYFLPSGTSLYEGGCNFWQKQITEQIRCPIDTLFT